MKTIKSLLGRFDRLSGKRRLQIVTAVALTFCMIVSIPSYAWFMNQKKAAEMFKVEYPNSLFVNAAHREDRVYFDLGPIDVNGEEKDEYGNTIYYKDADGSISYARDDEDRIINDIYGHPTYDRTDSSAKKIEKMQYVFSVSGTHTSRFTLQMGHTNNNKFTYTLYNAKQYRYKNAASAPAGTDEDDIVPDGTVSSRIVKYTTSKSSHNENKLQVNYDRYDDSASANPMDLFYVRDAAAITSQGYKNNYTNSEGEELGKDDVNDPYYKETYGSYTNVQDYSVPSYWQAVINLSDSEIDENNGFCRYFILEVTWDDSEQETQEKKETDMIYFSAKRS